MVHTQDTEKHATTQKIPKNLFLSGYFSLFSKSKNAHQSCVCVCHTYLCVAFSQFSSHLCCVFTTHVAAIGCTIVASGGYFLRQKKNPYDIKSYDISGFLMLSLNCQPSFQHLHFWQQVRRP